MEDLKKRVEFWQDHYFVKCHGSSNRFPFEVTPGWNKLYSDKKILEIGPGEGRQSDILMAYTDDYSVADIVPEVLNQEIFHTCKKKYFIHAWDGNLEEKYDTICFWYVLHHIKKSEGTMFFEFLSRFLKPDGHLHFNYSDVVTLNGVSCVDGDGTTTTPWTSELIDECMDFWGFKYQKDQNGNNVVVKASFL